MTAVKEPRVTNRWKFDAPKVNLKYDIPIQANMQMTLVNNEDVETIDVVKYVFRDYGIQLSYHKTWHGKEVACKDFHGDESLSFDNLRWYADAVMATNPGSYVELECTPDDHRFRRFFVCFGGSLIGFETGCRPLLFLDGTFLKSKYQSILLAIIAKNGDESFFPLAFSVVDQDTEDNWTWTLTCLKKIISVDRTITFIFDRGKGLMLAVPGVFPTSHHSYCLRHLKINFREAITDAAAYRLRIEDYTRSLAHMRGYSEQAAKLVEDSDPNH
ncbi:hypothetical protein QJS04_geneDACA016117 [Acorus gramineus]|uniref:MULE transposase domain-containing protein n=1 Tax=Acorus gramineus TaxID=55184 RepID=A0AAV9BXI9_ACOGR|nr:hypothetical protein QJS04_geneDACA016117 [Acorus gramineus]